MRKGHQVYRDIYNSMEQKDTSSPLQSDNPKVHIPGQTEDQVWPWQRLAKTVLLVLLYVCNGASGSMNSTTLVDFSERLHQPYGTLGYGAAIAGPMVVLGGMFGGVLRDRLCISDNLVIGSGAVLHGMATWLKPFSGNVVLFMGLMGIEGFASGGLYTVGTAMILNMWMDKAASPLNSFHLGYAVGSILAPIMAKPFLSQRCLQDLDNTTISPDSSQQSGGHLLTAGIETNLSSPDTGNCSNSTTLYLRESRIEIPFAIVGMAWLVIGSIFVTLFFLARCRRSRFKEDANSATHEPSSSVQGKTIDAMPRRWRFFLIILLILYYACLCSAESIIGGYLLTIAYESDLGFSKSQAADVFTVYRACITAGLLFSIIAIKWVHIKYLFISHVFMASLLVGCLTFWGFDSQMMFWVFISTLGVFYGPLWAAAFIWADCYFSVSASIVSLTTIGSMSAGAVANISVGYLVQAKYFTMCFLYAFVAQIILCVVIIILYISVLKAKDRHHSDDSSRDSIEFKILKNEECDSDLFESEEEQG